MSEMKMAELKAKLNDLDEKEKVELLCKLYKSSDAAEKNMNAAFLGDDYEKWFLEIQRKNGQELFPGASHTEHKILTVRF